MSFNQAVTDYVIFEKKCIEDIAIGNRNGDPLVNKINAISKLIVQVIIETINCTGDPVNIGKIINDIVMNKNYKQLMITLYINEKSYHHLIFRRLFEISNYLKTIINHLTKPSPLRYDLNISIIKFNQVINKLSQIKNNGYQEEDEDELQGLNRQETILGVKYNYTPPRKSVTNPFLKLYEHVKKDKEDPRYSEIKLAQIPVTNREIPPDFWLKPPKRHSPKSKPTTPTTPTKPTHRVTKQRVYRKVGEMRKVITPTGHIALIEATPTEHIMVTQATPTPTPSSPIDDVISVIEEYTNHEDRRRYSMALPPSRDISLYPRMSSLR